MIKKQHAGNGEPPPKKPAQQDVPMDAEADAGNGEPPPK